MMGKRKGRQSENTETLNTSSRGGDDESRNGRLDDLEEGEKSGFFACYLLTSLCPRYKGHTYIGFTVNPRRRIRQHNGELCSGAFRTKKKRPWEMVLCIYGFPTNVAALQFEWAWQHPVESLAVRKAAVGFKSLGGLANKIKLAYTMLTLPTWNNLNLNVNFFSTKYTKHYAGCPTLPSHMRVHVRSMDELPCYTEGYKESEEDDMFGFGNSFRDDDEEPVLVSSNHHNNKEEEEEEEEATSVSDTEIHEQEVEPVFVSSHHEIFEEEEEATSVSDTQNLDDSLVWVISDTPEKSFVSPVIEDGNGKVKGGMGEDGIGIGTGIGIGIEIPVSGGGVEVIDVFSPSPEYRASSRRKKRAVFVDCPEIIDLTQSPICV
ncbi:unnamed protein product [Lactuca virosa]|uniref:Structure-specific endonuclease subunit SLX1 homolog n=1 Tax=Lactuca virosa TaxID=75947 RepID=A0AAU9M7R6_9ASTR|nr:unnamed protein product [Lactuca virosa]